MLLELLALTVLQARPLASTTYGAQDFSAERQDPPQDRQADFDKRLKEAEGSTEKLWKVYDWCVTSGLDKQGRTVLRAILKIDDGDKKAHELLGEIGYDGKWFASDKKVEEYKKKQLDAEAKKTGKVIFNGELVDPADLPYLEKGMKKVDGKWVNADEQKHISAGDVRQDLEWISAADKPNVDKGLWKCGDQWLSEADANKYHAELSKWWRIPSAHYWVYSTCTREVAKKAILECEHSFVDLVRAFGRAPTGTVTVLVLNSQEQYNKVANGELGAGVELRPFSSLHGAFMAETWQEPLKNGQTSGAIAYWDASNDAGNSFGPTFVRHAAGQAFAEAIDPSTKTIKSLMAGETGKDPATAFWEEKQLPDWFRWGSANYVERYLLVTGADSTRLRTWSVSSLARVGGLEKLDKVFALELTLDDIPKSTKLILESGLLMAFVLDAKCAPVVDKHDALKEALKTGKDVKKAAAALEAAIQKNDSALRKFAGI